MQAVLVYLATAFLVPDIRGGERVDLKECYYRQACWFFAALLLGVLDSLVKNLVLTGRFQNATDLAGHAAFIGIRVAGITTRRARVHKVIAVVALLVFASYIALLFVPLPD